MNDGLSAVAVDHLLTINEISDRTGHSPKSILQMRSVGHELYSLARRAHGKRLALEESVVDDWVQSHKHAIAKRLLNKRRKQNPDAFEPRRQLKIFGGQLDSVDELDAICHHSWCMDTSCRGCIGAQW